MSAKSDVQPVGHKSGVHVEVLHDEHESGHGSLGGYITGFLLSVVLTAVPFYIVMNKSFADSRVTAALVMGIGLVQIIVHMIYFLHMNTKSEGGWTVLALIFTVVLVVITLSGSLWIMYHLDENMMPAMNGGAMPMSSDTTGEGTVPAEHKDAP